MKNFIKRITDLIYRKPLLVKPIVIQRFWCKNWKLILIYIAYFIMLSILHGMLYGLFVTLFMMGFFYGLSRS